MSQQAITDILNGLVAFGTLALAVATFWMIKTSARQVRQAVMPHPVVSGDAFFEKREAVMFNKDRYNPEAKSELIDNAVLVKNYGYGAIIAMQWRYVSEPTKQGAPRYESACPLSVEPGGTAALWFDTNVIRIAAVDKTRLILWYDDILGNHYRSEHRRSSGRWLPEPRKRQKTRPALADGGQ